MMIWPSGKESAFTIQETQETSCLVPGLERSSEWKDPLQASAWKTPWTEEPGGLQSLGTRWVGHDRARRTCDRAVLCAILVGPLLAGEACCPFCLCYRLGTRESLWWSREEGAKKKGSRSWSFLWPVPSLQKMGVVGAAGLEQFLWERIKVEEKLGILVEGLLQLRAAKARLLQLFFQKGIWNISPKISEE